MDELILYQILKKTGWLFFLVLLAGCNRSEGPTADAVDVYHFPVQPGTEEWRQLNSRVEMLAAVQIPQDVLDNMSTAGLVETVLNYPLYGDLFAHSSSQVGIEAIRRDFNGLSTLLTRPDAGTLLLERYQAMDLNEVQEKPTPAERGDFVSRVRYLEIILAQPEILSQLSLEERTVLLQEAMVKRDEKLALLAYYGYTGLEPTALLAGRILQLEGYLLDADPIVVRFLQDSAYTNDSQLALAINTIFAEADRFLATSH
jgi:hypothetical protein